MAPSLLGKGPDRVVRGGTLPGFFSAYKSQLRFAGTVSFNVSSSK